MFSYFSKDNLSDINVEVGIDEAGRGPLFGPVYAAAVVWDNDVNTQEWTKDIYDSKKISVSKRIQLHDLLLKHLKYFGIGYATSAEIDKINILNATKLAMRRAIDNLLVLLQKDNCKIARLIIDGVRWEKYFTNFTTISIKQGDNKYKSIAAASIIAKVEHDIAIKHMVLENPDLQKKYGLLQNKGYGTKIHLQGLREHGPSKYHRKTFKRCKQKGSN